jgi:putative MATE family efflux protein
VRQKASETDADLDEHILLLAVPALLSLLLDPLLTAADTAFVGKSEETVTTEANQSVFMKEKGENSGLAALAVSSSVFNFISYSGSFLAQATTPLVSREVALEEAKRKKMMNDDETVENEKVVGSSSASKTISAALALALVVGVSATFLVETNAEWLLGLSGGNSLEINAYESALEYVKIRALGLPFFCCSLIGIGAFRGVADTRSILNVALVSESVHFFLDWFLVLGLHLGVEGAGWSTFASTVLEFSLFSRAMFDRGILNVPPTRGEEDFFYKQRIKDFLENDVKDMSGKLGQLVSNGSNQLLRTLFLQFVLVRATALATENNVSGPHQIVSQVWWIELFVLDAIAVAAQTLVSTRLAKNDGSEEDILAARKAVDRCLFWSFLLGVLLTVVTELFSNDLPKIFTGDAAVAAATFVPLAFILAPLQPLNAMVFVGDGVFQGANDFKFLSKAMIVCSLFALAAFQTPIFADAFDSGLLGVLGLNDSNNNNGLERVWLGIAVLMLTRAASLGYRYWLDPESPLAVVVDTNGIGGIDSSAFVRDEKEDQTKGTKKK